MNERMELWQASLDDLTKFTAYIKVIWQLEKYLDELKEVSDDIFDEIHDAKVRIENKFVAFVKDLQPELR